MGGGLFSIGFPSVFQALVKKSGEKMVKKMVKMARIGLFRAAFAPFQPCSGAPKCAQPCLREVLSI